MKRFPSSRCASAIQIVRPRESTVATQPQLNRTLGWQIFVYRPLPGVPLGSLGKDALLASWHTGRRGLGWLDEFVRAGKAVDLSDKNSSRYVLTAKYVLPKISRPDSQVLPGGWHDRSKIAQCPRDALLLISACERSITRM
jgi:hypothetical protein